MNSLSISEEKARGISSEQLSNIHRTMLLSREIDSEMMKFVKQGKATFHIGASGHEAVQLAAARSLSTGKDWVFPYYRDLTLCLGMGFSVEELFLDFFGKEESPSSKGRQMFAHWGHKSLRIISQSACTGSHYLHAVGAAIGCKKEKKREISLVSSGEGATSQGDFHEAINWSAREKLPVVFLIQDNGFSISVPKSEQTAGESIAAIGRGYEGLTVFEIDGNDFFEAFEVLETAVAHARNGKGPCLIQANVVRLLPHSSSDDHLKYRSQKELDNEKFKDCIDLFEKRTISTELLSRKTLEENRVSVKNEISDASTSAWKKADPRAQDVAKNVYSNKELNLPFEKTKPSGDSIVMVDAINHALDEELKANPKMVIYGEDVAGRKGGVFTATKNLTEKYGKDRVFNSQLAESSIVGTALGLSVMGYKPVVEIQFSDYIFTSMMQLRNEVAMLRYRSAGSWTCPMVIRVPTGGYISGGHYHSQNIEAFFAHMPGIYIAYPSNAADAKGLLKTACRMDDPVLFLEHKYLYRQTFAKSPEPDSNYFLEFGKANVLQTGDDATIITYGALVQKALEVSTEIQRQTKKSIELIDIRTICPYDKQTILNSVKKTGKVLVAHEDVLTLGFGTEIAAFIAQHAFEYLDAPIQKIGATDSPVPYHQNLEDAALPNKKTIYNTLKQLLAY